MVVGRATVARMRRALTLLLVLIGLVAAAGGVASGHPFGPPPVAAFDVDGREVTMTWSAAEDDYTILGGALGLSPTAETFVFDTEGQPIAGPPPVGQQLDELAGQDTLHDYLAQNVRIRQEGQDCPLAVDTSRLSTQGVMFAATCPGPVTDLDVRITLLHDLHPAYRTVGLSGPNGVKTLFTQDAPQHVLAFAAAEPSGSAVGNLWGLVAAMIGIGAVGVWLVRRRGRAHAGQATT